MIKKFINLYIEGFRNIGNTGKQLVGILFFKILIFFVIMFLTSNVNDKLKKEFDRYKKYLKIKRIRSYKGR